MITYYVLESNKHFLFRFLDSKGSLSEGESSHKNTKKLSNSKRSRNPSLIVIFASLSKERKLIMAGKLFASILIDLIGDGNLIFPISEQYDIIWAFLSAFLIRNLYQSWALAIVNFVEEILPLVDVIPTATTAWLIEMSSAARVPLAKQVCLL